MSQEQAAQPILRFANGSTIACGPTEPEHAYQGSEHSTISDTYRLILLGQANARLESQRDRLLRALKGLQGECFCGVGIGDPSLQGRHTRACDEARHALSVCQMP